MRNEVPPGWTLVQRPPALFRRFEFASYAQTRGFLDALATLSERTGLYPDLSFGPRHVNVTIHGDAGPPGEQAYEYALSASAAAAP